MLLGFFMPTYYYRKGLKEGYEMAKGKLPEPIKNPVKSVINGIDDMKENKQLKEEHKVFLDGLNNLMAYDGDAQEGDKK